MIGFREACEKAIKEFGKRKLMYGFKRDGIRDVGHSWIFTGQAYPGDYWDNYISNIAINKETGKLKSYNKNAYDESKEYAAGKKMEVPEEYLAKVKIDEDILRNLIGRLTENDDSWLSFYYKGRYSGIHIKDYHEYDVFPSSASYVIFCGNLYLACDNIDDIFKGEVFDGKRVTDIFNEMVDFTWHRDDEYQLKIDLTEKERKITDDFSYEKDIILEDYLKYILFAKFKKMGQIDEIPKKVKDEKEFLSRTLGEEWFVV